MTSPSAPADQSASSTCCGEGGSWAPKAGSPLAAGCSLCPKSSSYWRNNRADGQPYVEVKALSDAE
jgi:hypothetical protein